ncbi:hypothetical protein K2173_001286 [Erythroxylum novogranatense]|uniref:Uncharacterized protein n=1 Tax=Erythroxylum novogranatense TaxID=1862640 RepID=A0AAV8T397_9ROSI|nr:hypothetical protein K2173_001286 [Erythroxylum novogranatense]
MGNYVSAKLASPSLISSTSTKVILPNGEIRKIQQPTTAAELMMETPNFFIVNSRSLKMGARFCALNADDELEKATVYVMLPMHRKNSVVKAADLGALFIKANSAVKRVFRVKKVRDLPFEDCRENDMTAETSAVPRLSLDGLEEVATAEFMHRLSMSRSKKPLLETIDEEPDRL